MLDVLEVAAPPMWMEEGKCVNAPDPEAFHPVSKNDPQIEVTANAFCNKCPVQGECLGYALTTDVSGIWGGTTDEQRRALRRIQTRVKCLRCKSGGVVAHRDFEICTSCGISWRA